MNAYLAKILRIAQAILVSLFFTSPSYSDAPSADRLLYLLQHEVEVIPLRTQFAAKATFRLFADKNIRSAFYDTQICVVEGGVDAWTMQAIDIRKHGTAQEVYYKNKTKKSIAMITGGFFGEDEKGNAPLGFVKASGVIVNKRHPWKSGGVVVGKEKGISIFPINEFSDSGSLRNVVQSKPIIIEKGVNGILTGMPERFDRSVIAISGDGSVVLLVITAPDGRAATLMELAKLLLAYRTKTGSSIDWALAMDGGPGAHLYVPDLDRHCGSNVQNYFPNIIRFEAFP